MAASSSSSVAFPASSSSSSSTSSSSSSSPAPASSSESKSHKRLSKELSGLQTSPPPYVASVALPVPSSLSQWNVTVCGPPSSPYEGGRWVLRFAFPDAYPMRPPAVTFVTPIYHVNVSMKQGGAICQDIVSGGWSPVLRVTDVLERLHSMLSKPHMDTPLEPDIAELAQQQPKKYRETAQQWTKKHATP